MTPYKHFYRFVMRALFAFCMVFVANSAFACNSNQIDVNGDGSQCEDVKFEATVNTSDYDEFRFNISAIGTFYISCGGGDNAMVDWVQGSPTYDDTLDDEWIEVEHTTADTVVYKCGFDNSTTTHKVRIGGTATGYASSTSTPAISFYAPGASNAAMITALSGDLSSVFPKLTSSGPRFYQTFRDTTNLTSVPATLFASYNNNTSLVSNMFYGTFRGSGLTSIPENLFSGLSGGTTGAFRYTFYGCSSLNHIGNYNYIPGTFLSSVTSGSNVGASMFSSTGFGSSCPSGTYSVNRSNFGTTGKPWCSPGSAITYNMNGGSNYGNAPSYYIHGTGVTIDGTPTRSGYIFKGWTGSNGSTPQLTVTIGPNETGAKSYTANWGEPTFTLTTSSTDSFQFKLSPKGKFLVNCGNNGTLSGEGVSGNIITKTDTSVYTYTCTWTTAAVQTIGFGGYVTEYSTDSTTTAIGFNIANDSQWDTNVKKITGISGSLGAIFGTVNGSQPRFYRTFFAAVNLGTYTQNTIPAELFYGVHGTPEPNMFKETFSGCTSLYGEIPETLFCEDPSDPTTENCIMGEPATGMFYGTFDGCTGLYGSIPASLFAGLGYSSTTDMFSRMFAGCSGLSSIKTGSTVTSYVPGTFLSAVNIFATDPVKNMLSGTGLSSSCPAGTYTVTSSQFSNAGKPWCSPCAKGTYTSSSGQNSCSVCPADTYVTTTGATSCTSCAAGYGTTGNTAAGHDSASDCTAKTYIVGYNPGQGGSGTAVTQSVTFNEPVLTKPANTFSKANATFVGWLANDGETLFEANHVYSYTFAGNLSVEALWNCNEGYTLDTDSNSSTYNQCVPCAGGTYKDTKGNGACTACPAANSSTQRTSFPEDFYNPTVRSFSLQTWTTGISEQGRCVANYYLSNDRGYFTDESVRYNTSTGKYDTTQNGNKYYTKLNAGYYLTTKYSSTYCDTNPSSRYMYYKDTVVCPAGSYCPGYTSMPLCSSGTYGDTLGLNPCPNGTYTNTAGQSSCTACATGYHNTGTGNTSCTANSITIVWDGVTSQEDLADNVRYTTYGGDIHTPTDSNLVSQAGADFIGWRFKKS